MKTILAGILAMSLLVVASNILVQVPIGQWLTWGAFTYPFTYLVSELVNRFEGKAAARKVVLVGFGTGLLCSLIGTQIMGEFGPLVTLRVALASGVAFFLSQMLDVTAFDRLRHGVWWRAPFVSGLLASSVDTAIFFTLAFSAMFIWIEPGNDVSWATGPVPLLGLGPLVPLWASLALADWGVKLLVDLVALMPFRLAVARYRTNAV
jgi:uncharacterized integral membrane protein (TIGR00697 family)